MPSQFIRSAAWAPTIALSWFWGLGFFYAIHVTLTYGWLGFLAFALPNATGLGLFGWVLGAPRRNLDAIVAAVQGPYALLFMGAQFFAVAITIFGFAAYAWLPLFGHYAAVGVIALVLVACSIGHAVPLRGIRIIHSAALLVGLAASVILIAELPAHRDGWEVSLQAFDERFYGLIVPSLVGFLLGPWMDIQQWQRAVEIRRSGGSVRAAYGAGALLFLGLLTINALLAAQAGLGTPVVASDGLSGAYAAVAQAAAREPAATAAFVIWTAIAAATTIDSFYSATRWLGTSITARSNSPLLAFVPAGLVASPVWILAGALATAAAAIWANLSLLYLMMPFATLLVGAAACLVCETLGAKRRYDSVLTSMIGATACLIFVTGYLAPSWALLAIAPLIGLIGALPMIAQILGWRAPPPVEELIPAAERAPRAAPVPVAVDQTDAVASHGFDGHWFVLRLIPTYDDTNSVGNVYFANYVRWVGKARELFFNICMPNFDLKSTDFYVLTKSFHHDFRREAMEFEPVTVRISIASHNRKFVTLAHEIHSEVNGLLGRGEQSLMFVDTVHYRPLDIPRTIVEGFLPYWPKSSPHAVAADPSGIAPLGV